MFGRRKRHEERMYWQGFREAAKRIHRDALVTEVSRLSLKPGDKLVVKVRELTADAAEAIKAQLKPRFPDNEILVCNGGVSLEVVEEHPSAA